MTLNNTPFEKIVGKGENVGNQHFLLFPKMFSTQLKIKIVKLANFTFSSANAFNLDQSKILSFGKEIEIKEIWCHIQKRTVSPNLTYSYFLSYFVDINTNLPII